MAAACGLPVRRSRDARTTHAACFAILSSGVAEWQRAQRLRWYCATTRVWEHLKLGMHQKEAAMRQPVLAT
eukprot:6175781-Pleurochrysis_carterae.AAC.3